MHILLALVFLALLCGFGFSICTGWLRVQSLPMLIGLSPILGLAAAIIGTNTLGYLLPIRIAMVLCILMIVLITAYTFWKRQTQLRACLQTLQTPPRALLLLLTAVALLGGIAYMRAEMSDAWTPEHYIVPSTIIAGNFPVEDPNAPWLPLAYHYGTALFAALASFLTGISVVTAYALLPIFCSIGIVFLATALGWELSHSWRASVLAGVLAFAGAGLFWLEGIGFIHELYTHYVLHQPIVPASETPLRLFTSVIRNIRAQSLIAMLNHRPIALGSAFSFGLICCFAGLWKKPWKDAVPWMIAILLLAAGAALTIETTFLLILAAVCIALIVIFLWERVQITYALPFIITFILIAIIARTQGGVLSSLPHSAQNGSFALVFDGSIHPEMTGPGLPLWHWLFLRDFGLQIILFVCAGLWLWRSRKKYSIPTFLLLLLLTTAFAHFLVPIIVRFVPRPNEMNRLFYLAFAFSSVAIGIFLWETLLAPPSRLRRTLGTLCICALLFSGILNAATRLLLPELRLVASPLIPAEPALTPQEQAMTKWVRSHTLLQDTFYYPLLDSPSLMKGRIAFGYAVGRFLLHESHAYPEATSALVHATEEHCSVSPFRELHVRYLIIATEEQAKWFASTCSLSEWSVAYDGGDSSRSYPRLYTLSHP